MDDILLFKGQWHFLSNFYPLGFSSYEGVEYRTSEHAYQAAKYAEPDLREYVRQAETPAEAKRRGREFAITTPDWENIKISVMDVILETKFRSHMNRDKLLSTGDAYLEEGNFHNDQFWGVCFGKGVGRNELGKALMRRREALGGYGIIISWKEM